MARAGWSLAPDDDAAEMYLWSMGRLEAAGYRQYEISNVAQPGAESRHNLKYWQDGEWLGFGCGAHSTRDGVRWKNVSATEDYIARSSGRALAVETPPTDRARASRGGALYRPAACRGASTSRRSARGTASTPGHGSAGRLRPSSRRGWSSVRATGSGSPGRGCWLPTRSWPSSCDYVTF